MARKYDGLTLDLVCEVVDRINTKTEDVENLVGMSYLLEVEFIPKCHLAIKIGDYTLWDNVDNRRRSLSGVKESIVECLMDRIHDFIVGITRLSDSCSLFLTGDDVKVWSLSHLQMPEPTDGQVTSIRSISVVAPTEGMARRIVQGQTGNSDWIDPIMTECKERGTSPERAASVVVPTG